MPSSPNDAFASLAACGHSRCSSLGEVALRIPRPPPPAFAFSITGYPMASAVRVGLAVHGDRLDVELAARADDPHRDLAPVRDEDLVDRRHEALVGWASQKRFPSGSAARATTMPYWSAGRSTISPPARSTAA